MSSEIEEGGAESTAAETSAPEESSEEELPIYDVTKPEMLEIMLTVTDILDKAVKGEIPIEQAKRDLQAAKGSLKKLAEGKIVTKKAKKGGTRVKGEKKKGGKKKGGKTR